MGASKTSDNKTFSDKFRDVAAANPGRDFTSAKPQVYKFDKEADAAAKANYQAKHPLSNIYTTEGESINTAQRQRERIAAQIKSQRNPKNRVS